MKCSLAFDDGTQVELATIPSIIDLHGSWSILGYDKGRLLGVSFALNDDTVRSPGDHPLAKEYGYDRPRGYVVKFGDATLEKANMSSMRGGKLHAASVWSTAGAVQHLVVDTMRNDEFKVTVRRCELSLVHP